MIKQRTEIGRQRAKAAGVRFGRKPKLTPHQQRLALQMLADGEPQSEVARVFAVAQASISRLAARMAEAA